MNRTARALVNVSFVWLVAGGLLAVACKGGGTLGGDDGGFDGEAARQNPGSSILADGGEGSPAECARALVTIDDSAATENASSGGPGCTADDECTVRFAGDYCACPSTPRPLLTSRATAFDEGLNGIGQRCTCPIPPCEPPQPATAGCRAGRCVLVDAGE
ncbi:MAG: hypothetical protein KF894_08695 [Labilithrix sp.]|nr:hypothetical protein [Labilithrix sp.]